MMVKKLSAVGNSLGLIIDRPILELLDITKDTPLEIVSEATVEIEFLRSGWLLPGLGRHDRVSTAVTSNIALSDWCR